MKISRRISIKVLLASIALIISSLSIYKWIGIVSLPHLSLLHKKKVLIAEIAELIIPRTNTPGAKDAKVEDFIINIIEFCSDKTTQKNFLEGLAKLESHALNNYHRDFLQCDHSEKIQILNYLENGAKYNFDILNKVSNKVLGKPFIIKFKELAVEGYCTSQLGATQGLAYDYLPVNFEACIPIQRNQRAWATK